MKIILDLTPDELAVLKYVVPVGTWGDPLKDLHDSYPQVENGYLALETLNDKIQAIKGPHDAD